MRILNTKQFRAIIAALLIQQSFQRAVSFQLHQALLDWVRRTTGSDGSVLSVFGRVGDVVATLNDYAASKVDNDSDVTGSTVKDALNTLDADLANIVREVRSEGQLYTHNSVATQNLTAGNEAKLTLWTNAGPSSADVTPSVVDDNVRVDNPSRYLGLSQLSIKSSAANTIFTFCGAVNDVSQVNFCAERKVAVAGDVGSCSMVGPVDLGAGDSFSIRVTADKDTALTLVQGQLVLRA